MLRVSKHLKPCRKGGGPIATDKIHRASFARFLETGSRHNLPRKIFLILYSWIHTLYHSGFSTQRVGQNNLCGPGGR